MAAKRTASHERELNELLKRDHTLNAAILFGLDGYVVGSAVSSFFCRGKRGKHRLNWHGVADRYATVDTTLERGLP